MDIVGLQYISYITTKEMGVLRVITVTENIQRAINALENSAPVITARSIGIVFLTCNLIRYTLSIDSEYLRGGDLYFSK